MGQDWIKGQAVIGRIANDFRIIIDAKLNVNQGNGVIAVDDIQFEAQDCELPLPSVPLKIHCNDSSKEFLCKNIGKCIPIEEVLINDLSKEKFNNKQSINRFAIFKMTVQVLLQIVE